MLCLPDQVRLLVLGGTAWLGSHIAATAAERGHDVVCLARGSARQPPPGVQFVPADRDLADAYDTDVGVTGARWDVVVDVARQPGHVRRAVDALADHAGSYVYVSSASVYADEVTPGTDESAPTLEPLAGDVMETMESYGNAKAACEQHVVRGFGADRCVLARAGLIGGPGDVSDRSGYWPLRFARPAVPDGTVLVPDAPDLAAQVIDVRDLASWLVQAAETRLAGAFNVLGETMPLAQYLEIARTVAGHRGPLAWATKEWLLAHHVEPWMGERSLPLWLPLPEYSGFSSRDGSAARRAGLVTRPVENTLADTLAWELTRPPGGVRRAGLTDADERTLLADYAASPS